MSMVTSEETEKKKTRELNASITSDGLLVISWNWERVRLGTANQGAVPLAALVAQIVRARRSPHFLLVIYENQTNVEGVTNTIASAFDELNPNIECGYFSLGGQEGTAENVIWLVTPGVLAGPPTLISTQDQAEIIEKEHDELQGVKSVEHSANVLDFNLRSRETHEGRWQPTKAPVPARKMRGIALFTVTACGKKVTIGALHAPSPSKQREHEREFRSRAGGGGSLGRPLIDVYVQTAVNSGIDILIGDFNYLSSYDELTKNYAELSGSLGGTTFNRQGDLGTHGWDRMFIRNAIQSELDTNCFLVDQSQHQPLLAKLGKKGVGSDHALVVLHLRSRMTMLTDGMTIQYYKWTFTVRTAQPPTLCCAISMILKSTEVTVQNDMNAAWSGSGGGETSDTVHAVLKKLCDVYHMRIIYFTVERGQVKNPLEYKPALSKSRMDSKAELRTALICSDENGRFYSLELLYDDSNNDSDTEGSTDDMNDSSDSDTSPYEIKRGVVQIPGDGDCCFRAVLYSNSDGEACSDDNVAAMRKEVAEELARKMEKEDIDAASLTAIDDGTSAEVLSEGYVAALPRCGYQYGIAGCILGGENELQVMSTILRCPIWSFQHHTGILYKYGGDPAPGGRFIRLINTPHHYNAVVSDITWNGIVSSCTRIITL